MPIVFGPAPGTSPFEQRKPRCALSTTARALQLAVAQDSSRPRIPDQRPRSELLSRCLCGRSTLDMTKSTIQPADMSPPNPWQCPLQRQARTQLSGSAKALLMTMIGLAVGLIHGGSTSSITHAQSAAKAPIPDQAADLVRLQSEILGASQESESLLLEAEASSPNSPTVHLLRAQFEQRRDDLHAALRAARRAEHLDERAGVAATAQLLGQLGAWPAAEERARRALQLQDTPLHRLLLAWILREQDEVDGAIEVLSVGSDPELRRELALLYLSRGEPEVALKSVEGDWPNAVDSEELRATLGLVLAALPERRADAVALLREEVEQRTIVTSPNSPARSPDQAPDQDSEQDSDGTSTPPSNLLVFDSKDAVNSGPEVSIPLSRLRLELGRTLVDLGRFDEALEPLEAAYDSGMRDPALLYVMATAYRRVGNTDDAARALSEFEAARGAEDSTDVTLRQAGATLNEIQRLATSNQLPRALEETDRFLSQFPDSATAHALRAKILFSMNGDSETRSQAVHAIRAAAKIQPGVVEFQYLEGLFLRTMGRTAEALEPLESAVALNPDLAEAHALLGGIWLDLTDPARSLEALDRAIALGAGGAQIDRARELAVEQLAARRP